MPDPLWQKVLLLTVDKLLFGAVIAFVAFKLQRRLEREKRAEAIFTEHAKMVLGAFARAMSLVHEVRALIIAASGSGCWQGTLREEMHAKHEALATELRRSRHFVGSTFFTAGLRVACTAREATKFETRDEILKHDFEIENLRLVMEAAIPPFARMPLDDERFRYPGTREAYRGGGVRDDWGDDLQSADDPDVPQPQPARWAGDPR